MSSRIRADEQFARLLEVHSSVAASEDPVMGSLANLANALRVVGQSAAMPSPDPVFRAELRQRLVAVATVQTADSALTRTPERRGATAALSWRVQKRIAALAGVATLGTSLAGVGVAAAKSLPGDPFYGVKRATENVQLWATRGDAAKGRKHLEFARTRLSEAQELSPNSSHLSSTLAAMDSETREGSSELITAYQTSHSVQPLTDLVTFTSQQISDLNQLADTLPASVKEKETQSVSLLTGVVKQVHKVANGVCILCGPNNGPGPVPTKTSSPRKTDRPNPTNTDKSGPKSSRHPTTPVSTHPSTAASTGNPKPTKTKPGIILPTDIVSSILHPKHTPSPIPIVTKLLGLLGGKNGK